MPTKTQKPSEATRAANTKRADELFKKGQRILAGEKPSAVSEPKPFLPRTVERIAVAIADILTYGGTPEDQEHIILAAISQEVREKSYRSAYGEKWK